ncbi:2TM domain-containing protein [Arenibacter sp. GZD96]|uniref:2TM domain-containing protein n=1 Tax=Aurantibrevibacter litoralis TaxID=3106030 RepID=UPI002AFDE260|nr:2TM domain-containing protein [Arenibacter sp. GZD-96]MEA1786131.1 2TM domain-containing protein [Arenibacter sp. GZD-96]
MENYSEEEAYILAKKRLDKLKGFYGHLASYVIVNLFLVVLVGVGKVQSGESLWDFGLFATPLFWGIGLLFHAFGVFGSNLIFGKKWEERKIQEYLKKEKYLRDRKWD